MAFRNNVNALDFATFRMQFICIVIVESVDALNTHTVNDNVCMYMYVSTQFENMLQMIKSIEKTSRVFAS